MMYPRPLTIYAKKRIRSSKAWRRGSPVTLAAAPEAPFHFRTILPVTGMARRSVETTVLFRSASDKSRKSFSSDEAYVGKDRRLVLPCPRNVHFDLAELHPAHFRDHAKARRHTSAHRGQKRLYRAESSGGIAAMNAQCEREISDRRNRSNGVELTRQMHVILLCAHALVPLFRLTNMAG